jgi:hypothetical protein
VGLLALAPWPREGQDAALQVLARLDRAVAAIDSIDFA